MRQCLGNDEAAEVGTMSNKLDAVTPKVLNQRKPIQTGTAIALVEMPKA